MAKENLNAFSPWKYALAALKSKYGNKLQVENELTEATSNVELNLDKWLPLNELMLAISP